MAEYRDFRSKTFEELDREVEEAVKQERKRRILGWLILLLIWIIMCPDMFLYWFRFATPHFPKYKTEEVIDINKEPVQVDITQNKGKYFKYKTLENRGSYAIEKMAKYSISGKIVAKDYFFWGNYLPNGDRPFQSMALIDIGMVWQDMANEDIMKCVKYVSAKTAVARTLYPMIKRNNKCYARFNEYKDQLGDYSKLWNKMSHTHVIPANSSIMHALMFAPKNKPVKMEGYLVDIYINGDAYVMTSLSRDDVNSTARGGGACETMYVERVQVGNKVYE